jgi:hypothetical protein
MDFTYIVDYVFWCMEEQSNIYFLLEIIIVNLMYIDNHIFWCLHAHGWWLDDLLVLFYCPLFVSSFRLPIFHVVLLQFY